MSHDGLPHATGVFSFCPGVFLDNIFLKILATSNSTYAHKKMALKVVSKLCQDPQTLVEIFLNYDCELGSFNIFQTMVNQLEKIAQGRFVSKNWMSEEQEGSLRYARVMLHVSPLQI